MKIIFLTAFIMSFSSAVSLPYTAPSYVVINLQGVDKIREFVKISKKFEKAKQEIEELEQSLGRSLMKKKADLDRNKANAEAMQKFESYVMECQQKLQELKNKIQRTAQEFQTYLNEIIEAEASRLVQKYNLPVVRSEMFLGLPAGSYIDASEEVLDAIGRAKFDLELPAIKL